MLKRTNLTTKEFLVGVILHSYQKDENFGEVFNIWHNQSAVFLMSYCYGVSSESRHFERVC